MSKLKGCMSGLESERFKNLSFCASCGRFDDYKDCKMFRVLNQRLRIWVETEV